MRVASPKLQRNHAGLDGFIWAIGVVEDRNDPLKLGRCKVRYLGWHTEDKTLLPTETLPWSIPLLSLDNGKSSVGPKEGDWICGFFRDGIVAQEPVMMGVFPGIPEIEANPTKGFNDPRPDSVLNSSTVPRNPLSHPIQHDDGTGSTLTELGKVSRYPQNESSDPKLKYVDGKEPVTNRFERGENTNLNYVKAKKDNVKIGQKNVPEDSDNPNSSEHNNSQVGSDKESLIDHFTEPDTPYGSKYPYNHAYFSESGHLIEIDDTPGAQRIHIYHRAGTFQEIHPNGLKVEKIVDKEHHIVLKGRYTHIEDDDIEVVDHKKQIVVNKDSLAGNNYDLTVGENADMNFTVQKGQHNTYVKDGDKNARVNKNHNYYIVENEVGTIKKNRATTVGADDTLHVYGNANIIVHKDCNVAAGQNITVEAGRNMTFISGQDMSFFCGGNMTTKVELNKSQKVIGEEKNHTVGNFTRLVDADIAVRATGNYQQKSLMYNEVALVAVKRTAPSITDTAVGPATYKCIAKDIKLQAASLINLDSMIDIKAKASKLVKLESILDNIELHAVKDVTAKAKQWITLEAAQLPGIPGGIIGKATEGIVDLSAKLNVWLNDIIPLRDAEDAVRLDPLSKWIPPISIPQLPNLDSVMNSLSNIAISAVTSVANEALNVVTSEINNFVSDVDSMVTNAVNTFSDLAATAEGIISQAESMISTIDSAVSSFESLADKISSTATNIGQSFAASALNAIASNVVTTAKDLVHDVIDNDTLSTINSITNKVSSYTSKIDTFINSAADMIEAGNSISSSSFSDLSGMTKKLVSDITKKVEMPFPKNVQTTINKVLASYEPRLEDYTLKVTPRADESGCDVVITYIDQNVCSNEWKTQTSYKINDRIIHESNIYVCEENHVSSDHFEDDLLKWNGGNPATADVWKEKYYYDGDRVFVDSKIYRCNTRHQGGTSFPADSNWDLEREVVPVEVSFFIEQTPIEHK